MGCISARVQGSYRRVGRSVVLFTEGTIDHPERLHGLFMPLDGGLDSLGRGCRGEGSDTDSRGFIWEGHRAEHPVQDTDKRLLIYTVHNKYIII